jgi:hypothetical protein
VAQAALYRCVDGKEGLFVLSIRHTLLRADPPSGDPPLKAPSLAELIAEAREFAAALTSYLGNRATSGRLRRTPDAGATARLVVETLTWFARHRYADPYAAEIGDQLAADTVIDALVHALVPSRSLASWPGESA